jgi:subtilase family serine protease
MNTFSVENPAKSIADEAAGGAETLVRRGNEARARLPAKMLFCSLLALVAGGMGAQAAVPAGFVIAGNTPRFVATADRVGAIDPATVIDATVWLKPHNRDALDTLVGRLYDPKSPDYHHWIKRGDIPSLFGPADDEVSAVRGFLQGKGLAIVGQDPDHFYLRVRGTVADVQRAFNVELANFSFRGKTLRANVKDPRIDDPAGAYVMAIEGLDTAVMEHPNISQTAAVASLQQGGNARPDSAAGLAAAGSFNSVCFPGPSSLSYTTNGAPPTATYTGNSYAFGTTGCGYTPPQIQAAYGLTALYNQGYTGAGQNIVIVDWCGSPTILNDANAYSKKYGLPALVNGVNFGIINYPEGSTCAGPDAEINIDVEWSHAVAPGANIVLVVPPSASFQDIDSGLVYIVENDVGNVVSNSYASEELYTSSTVLDLQNFIIETGAAAGISLNFASGDYGDYTFDVGASASVSAPADSPYATAVGGISLGLTSAGTVQFQAGWGTNVTLLVDEDYIYDPAINFGFDFGSGGGPSQVFSRPSYQKGTPGKFRNVPDVSWLADPYTGGVIAISEPFVSPPLEYTVYGGTSLATPMFSGLWAIANQAAGQALGQAAPLLYGPLASSVNDVPAYGSTTNVSAAYTSSTGKNSQQSANALAQPLENTHQYYSVVWQYPLEQDTAYLLTFGTDSGLVAHNGYDYVTGLGVPNPGALISGVVATFNPPHTH